MEIVDQGEDFSGGALTMVVRCTLKVSGLVTARMSTIAMATASTMAMMAMISNMDGSVIRLQQFVRRTNKTTANRHSVLPSPSRAGESHVRWAKLLPWKENLILKVSPDSRGDCFGQLCRMLFAVGRSSEEPSTARSDRDAVYCAAGHAGRCHDLLRHRTVWAGERSTVAYDSGAGAWDTEPRHLQPCLSHPRSGQLRKGLSALYQGICDDDQNKGRRSSRRQRSEKSLRTRPKSHAASDGDGVERNDPHGARQCAGAWKQRSGRRFASHRTSSAEGLCRHGGCAALSPRDGEGRRGARWGLRLGGKEQPAGLAARCQGRHLYGRAQEGQKGHHQGYRTRSQRNSNRDRCSGQGYGRKAQLPGSQGRRADHQQTWTRQDRPTLLPSDSALHARRTAADRSRTLGHRKRPALDARRRSRRGSDAKPKRPRSRQPCRSAATCPQYCPRSSRHKDLLARQAQTRCLGRQLPRRYAPEHAIALPARGEGKRPAMPLDVCAKSTRHAASMRRKPFHIAVAAPEVSTGKMRVS